MYIFTRLSILCTLLWGALSNPYDLSGQSASMRTDSLPTVFEDKTDLLQAHYKYKAIRTSKFYQPPSTLQQWEKDRIHLKEKITELSGAKYFKNLPLNTTLTGIVEREEFTINNIYFQTQPDVYATANLYVPKGKGIFPAIVLMMGHSQNGKLYSNYQSVGQSLAKEGYVVIAIDPWGAGERTTEHGEFEYHGGALGASLYTVGESLLGMQLTDNRRAIDLLESLPYVDKNKIGATGASGGGNQTMWLAAMDERVKAAMPVVSVGTFHSYIMAHNCVCEVLPKGLELTEEWAVLGLVAPRAIKLVNHHQESNPTFYPKEMLKSYQGAQKVFSLYNKEDAIANQCFDRPHGYFPEDREAAIGWFDLHLKGKGDGNPRNEKEIQLIDEEALMVFKKGIRAPQVKSTADYVNAKGEALTQINKQQSQFDRAKKQQELREVLAVNKGKDKATIKLVSSEASWEKYLLEMPDQKLLPLLLSETGSRKEYAIIAHAEGKNAIPLEQIDELKKNYNLLVIDLSGTGEAASVNSVNFDKLARAHTYGRAALWLGETVVGNWVDELTAVVEWLHRNKKATHIHYYGYKEVGLAGIFSNALGVSFNEIHLYQSPASLVLDAAKGAGYFGLTIAIPKLLQWGDLSLAAALGNAKLHWHSSTSYTGLPLSAPQKEKIKLDYTNWQRKAKTTGTMYFD